MSILEEVISDLACPNALTFTPGNNLAFIERDKNVFNILKNSELLPSVVPNTVSTGGDGGLLGMAIDPFFATNAYVYFAQTVAYTGGQTINGNQVVRYVYDGTTRLLREPLVLLQYDSNKFNNGGCLKFGPDGHLYLATGNVRNFALSQDYNSKNGKILRFTTTGEVPADNPFIANYVWAAGFRHPMGLCWNGSQLYASDTGVTAYDKINLIVRGGDYGYPSSSSSIPPTLSSGQYETWQPCGMCVIRDAVYFAALGVTNGYGFSSLNKTKIIADTLQPAEHYLVGDHGRIRDCVHAPDGMIYFSTSNNDGVGDGSADSIYRIAAP